VREIIGLEVKDDEALEQIIVEHEINVKVLRVRAHPHLPSDKSKALAQLKQESLQVVNQALLQSGFQEAARFRQAQELQQYWITHELAW